MREVPKTTRILVIESDFTNFQVRKCIAQALNQELELVHAGDVAEGLKLLDRIDPDAIIFSDEDSIEKEFLLDNLGMEHPPLVMQTEESEHFSKKQTLEQNIMYVPFYDTLEGMHQVIVLAAALGDRCEGTIRQSNVIH